MDWWTMDRQTVSLLLEAPFDLLSKIHSLRADVFSVCNNSRRPSSHSLEDSRQIPPLFKLSAKVTGS